MNIKDQPVTHPFQELTPELVITVVEKNLDRPCTNLCRPLNSYVNRVYELEDLEGNGLIAKFYRPGRWSKEALQDEHDFVNELHKLEIPVIAPLPLAGGGTLGVCENIHFAVFPKKGGRSYDEYSDDQWEELGRLIGRVHEVGAQRQPRDRIVMAPDRSTRDQVDYILTGSFIPDDIAGQYRTLTDQIISEITPMFAEVERIRIHGDCHFSNLIYRPGESFFIIDFDDMVLGPPVQDFWMLLPGYREESLAEIEIFLEGYEMFRDFDMRTLRLIEPLRIMRYIHYSAWCAHQVAEDGLARIAPDFGSREYWQREIRDLTEQLQRIRKSRDMPTGLGNG